MNAFLGAIRNANLLVMLVSAAVFLFALSPNDVASLRRAQAQIEALQTLSYDDYALSVVRLARPSIVEDSAPDAFAALARWRTTSLVVSVPYVVPRPHENWALQQIVAFFLEKRSFFGTLNAYPTGTAASWPSNDWLRLVQDIMKEGICADDLGRRIHCKDVPPEAIVTLVTVNGPPEVGVGSAPRDGGALFYERMGPESFGAYLRSRTLYDYNLGDAASGELHVSWSRSEDNRTWSMTRKVALVEDDEAVKDFPPIDWLRRSHSYRALVPEVRGKSILLSEVAPFWDDVYLQTPKQAVTYLQGRIDSSRQPITLFGLTIDSRIVLMVGPLSIAIASLYLLSLVRMLLIGIEKSKLGTASFELYPWMGVFSDKMSVFVTTLSLVIAPPFASLALLVQYWSGVNEASAVALIGTILVIVISVLNWRALTDLRERFRGALLSVASIDADD